VVIFKKQIFFSYCSDAGKSKIMELISSESLCAASSPGGRQKGKKGA
jgi:hypothetical protein